MKEKKDEYKTLKEVTPEKFQEMFCEWYLPALKAEAHKLRELERRVTKLERPGK